MANTMQKQLPQYQEMKLGESHYKGVTSNGVKLTIRKEAMHEAVQRALASNLNKSYRYTYNDILARLKNPDTLLAANPKGLRQTKP